MVTKRVILFNRASAPLRYARRGLVHIVCVILPARLKRYMCSTIPLLHLSTPRLVDPNTTPNTQSVEESRSTPLFWKFHLVIA